MQLMIDLTATNDAATLRRVAALLIEVANASEGAPRVPEGTVHPLDRPTSAAPVALPSLGVVVVPPAPVPSPPAAIIPPPPPPAPTETTSVAPVAAATVQPASTGTSASLETAANVQLDKRGFPHDARIHSATPSINKSDDCWRGRRGLDNATLEAVEAELRAKGYGTPAKPSATPAPPAAVVPPPPPPSVPLPPSVPAPPAVVVAGSNAPAPTVMVPPPPPVANGLLPGNGPDVVKADPFRVLMGKLKGHTNEGGPLRREIMAPIYAEFGVSGPQDFFKKKEQIPAFLARVDQLLGV